jgi:hypothetical protein
MSDTSAWARERSANRPAASCGSHRLLSAPTLLLLWMPVAAFLSPPALASSRSIQGRVFEGSVGDESTPIPGVTIELRCSQDASDQGTVVATTTTSSNGWYGFDFDDTRLTCDYYNIVEYDLSGYASVGATTVSGSVVNPNWIQIASPLGSQTLTGNKFWDEGEEGGSYTFEGKVFNGAPPDESTPLASVTVELYCVSPPATLMTLMDSAVTDGNGWYQLTTSGSCPRYYIIETTPSGMVSSGATAPGGAVVEDYDTIRYDGPIVSGTFPGNKFWDEQEGGGTVTFQGRVFHGSPPDESDPMAGVTVELYCTSPPPANLMTLVDFGTTGSSGLYQLTTNNSCASYSIVETTFAGMVSTGATAPSPGIVEDYDTIRYDAPLASGTYTGNKFWDDEESAGAYTFEGKAFDGLPPDESTPLANVTVELYCVSPPATLMTLEDTAVTDGNGWYQLTTTDSCPRYYVIETTPATLVSSGAIAPPPAVVEDLDTIRYDGPLGSGTYSGNKFWDSEPAVTQFYEFTGHVYEGTPPGPGTPMAGVSVELRCSTSQHPGTGPTIATTTTAGDGSYSLMTANQSCAFYQIIETNPAGYSSVDATTVGGVNRTADWIEYVAPVGASTVFSDNDFWDSRGALVLSGHVYASPPPSTTTPLPGATVTLYCSTGGYPNQGSSILTTTTAADGSYSLTSASQGCAFFHIVETNPSGYVSIHARSDDGVVRAPDWIEFSAAAATPGPHVNNDFWDAEEGSLPTIFSGHVLQGSPPDTSRPIAGVMLTLTCDAGMCASGGVALTTATTAADGSYLLATTQSCAFYHVSETNLAGLESTGSGVPPTGWSCDEDRTGFERSLVEGTTTEGIDFWDDSGMTPEWIFTGHVYTGWSPDTSVPIANVVVELYCSTSPYPHQGTLLASTDTDASGAYSMSTTQRCDYYHLIENDPPGYSSNEARSTAGTVQTPNWIQINLEAIIDALSPRRLVVSHAQEASVFQGNDFWDGQGPPPTPTPTPTPPAQDMVPLVPVVAHLSGVGGVPWRSDVAISNPTDNQMALELTYRPAEGELYVKAHTLMARETILVENVVLAMFVDKAGRGPLTVESLDSLVLPALLSRTFAAEPQGNLGQGLDLLWPFDADIYYVTGLLHDEHYRTNLSVSAARDEDVQATFDLLRGKDGEVMSSASRTIAKGTQKLWAIDALFPNLMQADVPMTVRIRTDQLAVPWASVVDNTSQDAITTIGRKPRKVWFFPVIARNPGKAGTYWRSDLALFNATNLKNQVTLEFLPEGRDNSAGGLTASAFQLDEWETVIMPDVVGEVFAQNNVKGSLYVRATQPLAATSRAYTTDDEGGTYGHGVPPVEPDLVFAESPLRSEITLAGVRTLPIEPDKPYRTNVGLITDDTTAHVHLKLRDDDGTVLKERDLTLAAKALRQFTLEQLFPGYPDPDPVGSITITTDAPLLCYISVVDGTSQDPIFAQVPFEPWKEVFRP